MPRPTYPPLTPRTLDHKPYEGGAKAQWLQLVQWDDHVHVQTLFADRQPASVAVSRRNDEIAISGDGVIAFEPPIGGTVSSIDAPPGRATLCWHPAGHRLIVNSSIDYGQETKARVIDTFALIREHHDDQRDSISDAVLSEATESCIKTMLQNTHYSQSNTVVEEMRFKLGEILRAAR